MTSLNYGNWLDFLKTISTLNDFLYTLKDYENSLKYAIVLDKKLWTQLLDFENTVKQAVKPKIKIMAFSASGHLTVNLFSLLLTLEKGDLYDFLYSC